MRRRQFLCAITAAAAGCATAPSAEPAEPVIDIHQHTNYHGRSDAGLVAHQARMGATTTVLLPAGRYYGLDAQCGGNDSCKALAEKHPDTFIYFANELPYLNEAKNVITRYLQQGARGIGEQKFRVLADSGYLERMAAIAREFNVPILLHFWDGDYNMELQRFHRILEKYPSVNFIGHAQSWWGHIDAAHNPKVLYPKGKVAPGGLTEKLLSDYPNMFGDLSAGSGLNALTRDPEFTRGFFERQQDKLLFGSDCQDLEGTLEKCTGARILKAVRDFAPSAAVRRKILHANAKKLLRL